MLCRLEEHDELQGMECLQRFDTRLAHAVQTAQQSGVWDRLVGGGGSSARTLALPTSGYDPEVGPKGF
jgi:hypothetical protein